MSGVPEGSARRHARIWPSRMTQDCAQTSWLGRWLSRPQFCSGFTRASNERLPLGHKSANPGLPGGGALAEGQPRRSDDRDRDDNGRADDCVAEAIPLRDRHAGVVA